MGRVIGVGIQSFEKIRSWNCFYVDKTHFIKEWWERGDDVTLITRPRRFGKTLNMSMLECFFSNKYAGRSDLFEGLEIWEDEAYRELQGTYPVVFLSFADIKSTSFRSASERIKENIEDLYRRNRFLIEGDLLSPEEKEHFLSIRRDMSDELAITAIRRLMEYMARCYGKRVIILMDEYDTPMQEAYLSGYWDEITELYRNLFNATFKTNPFLERGIMTGITRVSRESIFSDLNNLKVVTTTSSIYGDCFGFTEREVFDALAEMDLSEEKDGVKAWYDGFTFGTHTDIYNPWSITNFLDNRDYGTYWADTSSNGLISRLLLTADAYQKKELELLMKGGALEKILDEQIIFSQLDNDKNALWSLMLASGYLRADAVRRDPERDTKVYTLKLTNHEVTLMFRKMIQDWFLRAGESYNQFVDALLSENLEEMNHFMNEVALATFSSFDTGNHPSGRAEPERFYHGFVLGLLVELRGRYAVNSNRESGLGRYDVMLEPLKPEDLAFILEFKVYDQKKESDLASTVAAALQQIKDRNYAAALEEKGIPADRIRSYGFAFEGKKVLIGG